MDSTALFAMASEAFEKFHANPLSESDSYQVWRDLRGFGEKLLERRSLFLTPRERDQLALLISGCPESNASEFLLSLSFEEAA